MGVDVPNTEPIKEQPPTVRNIIEGHSKIIHVGEGSYLQNRTIGGREYQGSSHQYEVTLPHPFRPEETWTTYLTRWDPTLLEPRRFERNPDPQLFITTGKGEMEFTNDSVIKNKVFDEIHRQMEEQRKEAEAK